MIRVIIIIVSLIIVLGGCKSQKSATNKSVGEQANETKDLQELVLLNKAVDSINPDYFEVHSFSVVGDVLEVFVSYGGGCGEARFDMYYTQRVMHSMPPQTVIHLGFADDDPCRSVVTRKLTFSLEPFKHLADNGGVWLILGGSELRQLYKNE